MESGLANWPVRNGLEDDSAAESPPAAAAETSAAELLDGLPGLAAVHLAEMKNGLADLQFRNDWDANPAAAAPSAWQELISAAEPLGVSPGLGMADFPFRSTVSAISLLTPFIFCFRPKSIELFRTE